MPVRENAQSKCTGSPNNSMKGARKHTGELGGHQSICCKLHTRLLKLSSGQRLLYEGHFPFKKHSVTDLLQEACSHLSLNQTDLTEG